MNEDSRAPAAIFREAERRRAVLDDLPNQNSPDYQNELQQAINIYNDFSEASQRAGIFSTNESVDDIASSDLKYLVIDHQLADLITRLSTTTPQSRIPILQRSQHHHRLFLTQLSTHDILSAVDETLFEHFKESPTTFSVISSSNGGSDPTADASARRDAKIQRFKTERDLQARLAHLQSRRRRPATNGNSHTQDDEAEASADEEQDEDDDDDLERSTSLLRLQLLTHHTFAALESIAQELHILSLAPLADPQQPPLSANNNDNDARLDSASTLATASGPILSRTGQPLRPFTLLDKRSQLRAGVFRPDHNLPTMTIDEYLAEERKRGGIIDGGGEASGKREELDEDDEEAVDRATMKARAWDEFTEENPKGAGNTINRG